MSKFSKWLGRKAHELRVKRIFKKYGPASELGGNLRLCLEKQNEFQDLMLKKYFGKR